MLGRDKGRMRRYASSARQRLGFPQVRSLFDALATAERARITLRSAPEAGPQVPVETLGEQWAGVDTCSRQ